MLDVSKIIFEAIVSVMKDCYPIHTLPEGSQCGKTQVRQPIFQYFHHILAQICI